MYGWRSLPQKVARTWCKMRINQLLSMETLLLVGFGLRVVGKKGTRYKDQGKGLRVNTGD